MNWYTLIDESADTSEKLVSVILCFLGDAPILFKIKSSKLAMPNSSMTCHVLCKHEDISEEIEAIVQIHHCFYVFPDPGLKDYNNQTRVRATP